MRIARIAVAGTALSAEVTPDGYRVLDADGTPGNRWVSVAEASLLPAITPGAKFICVGLNYRDHAAEAGAPLPETPLLFAKLSNSLLASGAAIRIPPGANAVDWEGELGVVIGRRATAVLASKAMDYVLGYTAVNDVSARDFQFADGQWFRGKSADTFGPVGPTVVTADEIGDVSDLEIETYVNGERMQRSRTSQLVFGVPELVSYVSRWITLEPGDLIATGTPHGVGFGMTPQRYLGPGDVVEVRIQGLDALINPVVADGE